MCRITDMCDDQEVTEGVIIVILQVSALIMMMIQKIVKQGINPPVLAAYFA